MVFFFLGIANYFVRQIDIQNLRDDIIQASDENMSEEKFRNLIERYHDKSLSNKFKNEDEIEELFNTVSFSEFYDKLTIGKTDLQILIAKKMRGLCLLSLRIIFEILNRGKNMSLKDCFIMEFDLANRLASKFT